MSMMPQDGDAPDPAAVVAAFGLGGAVTAWETASGAWSNRVYRLGAAAGTFAVKEMRNPWEHARWQEWLAESWSFERQAIAAGVAAPDPVPNPADGGCLAWVARLDPALPPAPVRVHHWVRGLPVGTGPAGLELARWAGRVLAVLHGLRVRPRDRSLFPVPDTRMADRWAELAGAAERSGVAWAGLLRAAAPAVSRIASLARAAAREPGDEVMSHGDIDQKNLIAGPAGPVLCDWDLAVPVVPRRELADVALSLAGWTDSRVAREVVRAYREAGGEDAAFEPSDLGPSLMSGVDWIAFNVERATGLRRADPAEVTLAGSLVPGLLAGLPDELDVAFGVTDRLGR